MVARDFLCFGVCLCLGATSRLVPIECMDLGAERNSARLAFSGLRRVDIRFFCAIKIVEYAPLGLLAQ